MLPRPLPSGARLRVLIWLHDESDASEDPLVRVARGAKRAGEDKGWPADRGGEDGARVEPFGLHLVDRHGNDVDHRHGRVELLGPRLGDAVLLHVPPRALHEEAVDVGALLGLALDRRGVGEGGDVHLHAHRVEREVLEP
eukprot:3987237-Pleurochrysis_carterae.AAC.1